MNERDVERQLVAVLHRHAEEAMNLTDTQTAHDTLVFGGQGGDPGPSRWRLGAAALVAAAVAVAGVVVLWSDDPGGDTSPAPASDQRTVQAVAVAEAFLGRLVAKDAHGAAFYLAPGHEPWDGWTASLRRDIAWQVDYDLAPCTVADGDGPGTRVDCPYSMQLLSSAEAGAGPFTGNVFKVQVLDGEVVWVENALPTVDSDYAQYLFDVRAWIAERHPDELAFLLTDERDLGADEWVRWTTLWREYAAAYAASVG